MTTDVEYALECMKQETLPDALDCSAYGVNLKDLDPEGTRIALGWALSQLVSLKSTLASPYSPILPPRRYYRVRTEK